MREFFDAGVAPARGLILARSRAVARWAKVVWLICLLASLLPSAYAQTTTRVFGNGNNQFTMDFVTIGNPNNVADTTGTPNPVGSVAYTYNLGKYEVSREQIDKANTAGGLGITMFDMSSFGGNGVNKPATGVTWHEAAKFVNWLNTSTGGTAAYKFVSGTLQPWAPTDAGYNANNLFRNSQAKYVIASRDEWYKGAYGSPNGTWYNYPTGSDSRPSAVAGGTAANTAVYSQSISQGPADINNAGGLSSYGTMGQGGNVWEWNETAHDGVYNTVGESLEMRGGSWDIGSDYLPASYRNYYVDPAIDGNNSYGFRVAIVSDFNSTINNGEVTITGYTGTGGNVEIPATIGGFPVRVIGYRAFDDNKQITGVVVPEGITHISAEAFQRCNNLASINLPTTLVEIGSYAFLDCKIKNLEIPEGVIEIKNNAFMGCGFMETVQLPSTLIQIGNGSFGYCSQLTEIIIPENVSNIGVNAFQECGLLGVVIFQGVIPPVFDGNAFSGIAAGAKGYYPATASAEWGLVNQIGGLTLVELSNNAPTLASFSILPIVQESFASSPLRTGIIDGSASISGGECILTPAITEQNGYLAMNKLAAASPTAFSAQFDYRAYEGSGADGTSFSYGNFSLGWTDYYENGLANGLVVRLNEYISKVEAVYNGISLGTASFNPMNPNYRTVVIQVDLSGQLSVSIGGTSVLSNISLPAAYATADKSAWQFVFGARCGGQSNKHSLKNLLIRGVGVGIPSGFTFTEDQPGNLVFSGTPFADEDSTNLTVTLSVQDGTITGNSEAGVAVGGTETARTFAGSVGALNSYFTTTGTISYLGASNNATARQITITATDGVSAASQIIEINFTPVNDAPVLAEILGSYSGVFNQPQTIPLSASDLETPIAQLVFTVSSSNPTLFPNGSMNVVVRSDMARELVVTPATGQSGDADITVTVSDGNGALASRTFHITVNAALISSGFSHTLYLGAGATTVTAWGLNTDGRLGVGNMDSPVNWAKAVDGDFSVATVTGLAAGGTHSLILANGKVYAAGSDRFGQLGQGGTNRVNRSSFIQVFAPTSRVVAVSAGGNHSLALTEFGDVYACGDNTYGQLGNSELVSSANWIKVSIQYPSTGLSPKIVSVVAGADHNLAVDEDGGVWVWGRNNYGQLGKGTRTKAEGTPSELNLGKINDSDEDVVAESVAAGFSHSLILTTDGKVFGFGRNNSGQTGQSATSSMVLVPTLISGLNEIRLISAGTDSSFAIDGAGQLRSWGYNAYGELLLGYASPSSSPAVYGPTPSPIATNVFNVAGGGYSSLAVGVQGVIFGGRNDVGQSGNGPDPDEVVGDYYYGAGDLALTNLTMDLAGTEPSLYDQIFLGNGAVTLNGILNLMFVGTYTGPVYGSTQTFDLIWANKGITLGTDYKLAFNQAGYLVESAIVEVEDDENVKWKVLKATVGAVESDLDSDKADALALAQARLDGLENVSYRAESNETIGVSQLSASPSPVEDRVEMIYSYERPSGGVISGAEYFIDEGTYLDIYRVKYSSSSPIGPWVNASVTGTTVTPLGKDSLGKDKERVTLRISSSGSAGFLRLEVTEQVKTSLATPSY